MSVHIGCCTKKYTLKLGDLYLAPKSSVAVEEPKDFETITLTSNDSCLECGGESLIDYRDIIFKLHFIGNGDLDTAWKWFDRLNATLAAGCASDQGLSLTRSIRCETPRVYTATRGFLRVTDTYNQYIRKSIVTVEMHLRLRLPNEEPSPYYFNDIGR